VILPAWNSDATIAACLESLRAQTFRDYEVIVVDSSPNERTAILIRERFPEVQFKHSSERLSPQAARNQGVALANGDVLVFSDPDCIMSPEWLRLLVAAMDQGHPLIGGGVGSVQDDWFSNGVHLCKFGWWLCGGQPGPRPELPTANVGYTADLFSRIGPFPLPFCGDTLLSLRASKAGVAPWFEPTAEVRHDHRTHWRDFLRERSDRGNEYGRIRPQVENWAFGRSLAYAFAAPLIVVVMLLRTARFAWSSGHLVTFLRCSPVVVLGYTARAWGEAKGHWHAAWSRSR
jgi:glycosyltransferase involved in cell wall biosynthesis